MTVTNLALGQQINMATILNTKLEAPILQTEMGLNAVATTAGQAIRWNEFSLKHNNDGSFKTGIIASTDITNATITTTQISATAGIIGSQLANATIADAQVSTIAAIQATKLAIQKLFNKSSVANPSATINTNGTQVDLLPATGYSAIVPLGMNLLYGGTFGAETVSAQVIVTYSDATTATLTKTNTAIGTITLNTTDFLALFKDGVYINKLSVVTKSSIASSTATVTYNYFGHYM